MAGAGAAWRCRNKISKPSSLSTGFEAGSFFSIRFSKCPPEGLLDEEALGLALPPVVNLLRIIKSIMIAVTITAIASIKDIYESMSCYLLDYITPK